MCIARILISQSMGSNKFQVRC